MYINVDNSYTTKIYVYIITYIHKYCIYVCTIRVEIYIIYIYIYPRSEPSMRAAGRAKRTQAETRHRLQVQEAQSPITLLLRPTVSDQ